uniref:CSON015423 protein n=1 Tax=Culicoides sonorensis TaxID=179676 RepID=A0A336LT79_CULSO
MNELHTQVCFDALSVLNNVQYVESVCNLCGASHFTGNCPEIKQGTYVPDTPQQSFSRSSVPNGLLVMDSEDGGTCVITSQKFAKGTRFGPLQAPFSCFPIKGTKFPLIIFPTQHFKDEIADIQPLFNARNTYLDTTDENKCNWMIHVNTAKYSNEQNLMCYQENYEIYYAAIQDIELGDILKVWYSPIYASTIGAKLLDESPYDICNNILRQVSIDYGIKIDDNNVLDSSSPYSVYEEPLIGSSDKDKEISLPPVRSLMKMSSPPNYTINNFTTATNQTTGTHIFDVNIVQSLPGISSDDINLNFGSSNDGTLYDCDTGTAIVAASDVLLQSDLSNISSQNHNFIENEMEVDLVPPATTSSNQNDSTHQNSIVVDIVKFTCEVCNRKYATKLTFEKHLRSHDIYLCIVCDKLYHSLNEMQDHECYRKKNKTRPLHCNVCLKLLSNSWSLNRHMKIHRNTEEKPITGSTSTDESQCKQQEEITIVQDESNTNVTTEQNLQSSNYLQNMPGTNDIKNTLFIAGSQQLKTKVPGKRLEEPMECIVCRRPFKNPNALEKHLRFVHTVYVKDPSRPDHKKYAQDARNKSILTNNTAPIKPSIAKALASKLTKKKQAANLSNNSSTLEKNNNVSESDNALNNKRENNTIIIISNVELTNGNMFDTQQLLNNSHQNPSINTIQLVNDKMPKLVPLNNNNNNDQQNDIIGLQQPQYDPLSPVSVHNMDIGQHTESENMMTTGELPAEVIDVPRMIVIKKIKNAETVTDVNKSDAGPELKTATAKKEEATVYNCEECRKNFAKKYQLKRHQETHDLVFYTCPYCNKAPLKARSSLKKHFSREHNDKIHEWNTSTFVSKQILRDDEKLKELRKKYFEKKRFRIIANDKFLENCKNMHTDETSTSIDTIESVEFEDSMAGSVSTTTETSVQRNSNSNISMMMNGTRLKKKNIESKLNCDSQLKTIILNNYNNCTQNQSNCKGDQSKIVLTDNTKNTIVPNTSNNNIYYQSNSLVLSTNRLSNVKKQKLVNGNSWNNGNYLNQQQQFSSNEELYYTTTSQINQNGSNSTGGSSSSGTHSDESVISKSDEHEMIDNLFLENLDNLLDPLNGNEYDGDDDHGMQSVNYIQETFQNSFDKIQEKLDADLEVGHEQMKWEDTLKSDDSSDEIMSNKLLDIDENVMLI